MIGECWKFKISTSADFRILPSFQIVSVHVHNSCGLSTPTFQLVEIVHDKEDQSPSAAI